MKLSALTFRKYLEKFGKWISLKGTHSIQLWWSMDKFDLFIVTDMVHSMGYCAQFWCWIWWRNLSFTDKRHQIFTISKGNSFCILKSLLGHRKWKTARVGPTSHIATYNGWKVLRFTLAPKSRSSISQQRSFYWQNCYI